MKEPHPQSHVTHHPSGHMTNQRRYITTFARPMDPKLSRVLAQDEGTPSTMSRDTLTMWSRDKLKLLYLHFLKTCGYQIQEDTGYSVVATTEICAEGNWIIQVSAYFYPSLSKKSMLYQMLKKSPRYNGKLALTKNKHKNANTRTKSVEINKILTNSEIRLHHCLCESSCFKTRTSSATGAV